MTSPDTNACLASESSQSQSGLPGPSVVVGAKLDRTGCRDQPTDPTDRRDQLGDRVLGGDRVLRTVESSTRRRRPASTPVASTTSRTASKTRRGRCERRIRLRQYTSTVGWNPSSSNRSPQATFTHRFRP